MPSEMSPFYISLRFVQIPFFAFTEIGRNYLKHRNEFDGKNIMIRKYLQGFMVKQIQL